MRLPPSLVDVIDQVIIVFHTEKNFRKSPFRDILLPINISVDPTGYAASFTEKALA
jgi:hypothetical protein